MEPNNIAGWTLQVFFYHWKDSAFTKSQVISCKISYIQHFIKPSNNVNVICRLLIANVSLKVEAENEFTAPLRGLHAYSVAAFICIVGAVFHLVWRSMKIIGCAKCLLIEMISFQWINVYFFISSNNLRIDYSSLLLVFHLLYNDSFQGRTLVSTQLIQNLYQLLEVASLHLISYIEMRFSIFSRSKCADL